MYQYNTGYFYFVVAISFFYLLYNSITCSNSFCNIKNTLSSSFCCSNIWSCSVCYSNTCSCSVCSSNTRSCSVCCINACSCSVCSSNSLFLFSLLVYGGQEVEGALHRVQQPDIRPSREVQAGGGSLQVHSQYRVEQFAKKCKR